MKTPALPNALSWAERAACRGYDLDLFFSDAVANVREAKKLCAVCPVRAQCLAESLRAEDASRYGVSGGLTPAERAELDNERAPSAIEPQPKPPAVRRAPCGTRSAYQRHVRKGEPIDEPCRAANTEANRRLYTTGTSRVTT